MHAGELRVIGLASPGKLRRQPEPRVAFASRGEEPIGKGLGSAVDERGVHEKQALRRRDRGIPDGDALVGIGRVEEREEWMPPVALHHEIDTAPIGVVLPVERLMDREGPGVDRGEGMGGGWTSVEEPACRQERVAERLGIERAARKAPKEAVLRIGGDAPCIPLGRLPVGVRPENEPMEVLHPPARLHEADGERVEELRMGGPLATDPEITRRGNEPAAEVPLPDPIDEDPRGERVFPAREPHGQVAPPAPRRRIGKLVAAEELKKPARHFGPRLVGLAAGLDPRVGRRPLGHAVGHRIRGGVGDHFSPRRQGLDLLADEGHALTGIGRRLGLLRRRRPGGGERHPLPADIVDVTDRGWAANSPEAIADERVDDAIPSIGELQIRQRDRLRWCAVGRERGDRPVAGLRGMVERHADVVPASRLERRHDPPPVAIAHRELALRGGEVEGRRLDDAAADVETAGTGRLVSALRGDRAEIETDMERRGGGGGELVVERVAHPFVGRSRADAHAALSHRVDMPPRAL